MEWISVEDGLPDERCIAYTPACLVDETMVYRIIPEGLFYSASNLATHWMPLPEPPE